MGESHDSERLVRLPEVLARTGLSRATIYRKMARGVFPASIAIGDNAVAWRSTDFSRWLAAPAMWKAAA